MEIISLYDFSGEALKPWAHAGYACYAYDIEHPPSGRISEGIHYKHADLHDKATVQKIIARHKGRVKLLSAFPVCTDLAASGAVWWARKRECDPHFQHMAAEHAMKCVEIAEAIGCDSWYVENPVGALSRLWRKPDYTFDPCDYGAYLSKTDTHPEFPKHIPPRDAYRKRTCIWHGSAFRVPQRRGVAPVHVIYKRTATGGQSKYAPQAGMLGGTSHRTKRIRSATPRGWAQAVCEANSLT